jgi:lipoprotein-anchoring transpeptidase ErfK/SrfK
MNYRHSLLACAATAFAISFPVGANAFGLTWGAYDQPATASPTAYSDAPDYDVGREYPTTTRAVVADPTGQSPGTITVDTGARYLYLSLPGGQAVRYGIGVGREGFEWSGRAMIGRKAEWPGWTPPGSMLRRRPDLPRHMEGGIDNPLGARAMYLYSGNRDTLFRIHGSNEPWTIGHAVSSGCIRMLNADVEDLYDRVRVGTRVVVLR